MIDNGYEWVINLNNGQQWLVYLVMIMLTDQQSTMLNYPTDVFVAEAWALLMCMMPKKISLA